MIDFVSHMNFVLSVIGLLMGISLVFRSQNRASVFFALILILLSYFRFFSYSVLSMTPTLEQFSRIAIRIASPLAFIQPVLYLYYVKEVTKQKQQYRARDILHLLPFMLGIIIFEIPKGFMPASGPMNTARSAVLHSVFTSMPLRNWTGSVMAMGAIYSLYSLVYFITYDRRLKQSFSSINSSKRMITYILLWLLVLNSVFRLTGFWTNIFGIADINFYLVMRSMGDLSFDVIIASVFIISIFSPSAMTDFIIDKEPQSARSDSSVKYEKIGISSERSREICQLLEQFMVRDKPFLDQNLAIADIARKLSLPVNHLSFVINTEIGKNFYSYVNTFRVEHARQKIEDLTRNGQEDNFSNIALDSGFKSKTTFNTYFKQQTGKTPSEYKKYIAS